MQAEEVHFNHDTGGATADALTIRGRGRAGARLWHLSAAFGRDELAEI